MVDSSNFNAVKASARESVRRVAKQVDALALVIDDGVHPAHDGAGLISLLAPIITKADELAQLAVNLRGTVKHGE